MAIAFVNSQLFDNGSAGQSSYSPVYNLLTGSGNDRLVIVTVNLEDAETGNVSSVTLGGVSPAGSTQVTAGTGYSTTTWMGYWFESSLGSAGNKTIAVTCSEAITRNILVTVGEFTGISTDSVTQRFYTQTSTAAGNASTTPTVDEDNSLIVGSFTCGSATYGTIQNLTQDEAAAAGDSSHAAGLGHNLNSDTPSETVGWNTLSTRFAWVTAVFRPEPDSSSSSSSSSSLSSSSSSLSSSSSSSSLSSSSSTSSSSTSSSSSSTSPGTLTLGHNTGVVEDYDGDFEDQMNWQEFGNVAVSGTGDANILYLRCNVAIVIFDQYLGAGEAKFTIDKYGTGSGPPPQAIYYRTATTRVGLDSAGWQLWNGISFTSLGWVRVQIVK